MKTVTQVNGALEERGLKLFYPAVWLLCIVVVVMICMECWWDGVTAGSWTEVQISAFVPITSDI